MRKKQSPFQSAYSMGQIPCRIQHTASTMYLTWDRNLSDIDYDPLLVTIAEGLKETDHPYVTLARLAWKDMMEAPDASEKIVPLVGKLVAPLRVALLAKDEVFKATCQAIQLLSATIGPFLNECIIQFVGQIGKKSFDRSLKPIVEETLQCLEENGGPEACALIQSKVPTYSSSLS